MVFVLTVRLKQVYRALDRAGWGILLVLVLVTAGLWIPMLAKLTVIGPGAAAGIGLVLSGSVQLSRADNSFLKQTALPAWQICLLDTLLVLLPGSLLFLFFGVWTASPAFLGGGLAALVLPPGKMQEWWPRKAQFSVPLLPPDLFEWQTAIRRFPLGWLLTVLLQLGAWYHIAFFLAAVALGLALLSTVFEFGEPKELLPDSQRALLRKWRRYALAFHLFFTPGYLLALAGQITFVWLILYAAFALETFLALLFFYKYSVWQPGRTRLSGSVFAAVGLLLSLLPGGILAVVPLAVWTAAKARRRMRYWWQ